MGNCGTDFDIEEWDGSCMSLPSFDALGVMPGTLEAVEDLLSASEGPAVPRHRIEWLVSVVVLLERHRADKSRESAS